MSNYRVRQVLGLGPMPERQLRLLVALATWMSDDTRTVRVGFETLIAETGNSHNTVRNARRELEAANKLASEGGRGKGNLTVWTALCLPETAGKGTSEVGTPTKNPKGTSEVGTLPPHAEPPKGTSRGPQKVPTRVSKRYQGQAVDQQEPKLGFNSWANPLGSSLSRPTSEIDLLAQAVPGADERDIEGALDRLHYNQAHGSIYSMRAYLRKIIANGDARALVDDAAAERIRDEAQAAPKRPAPARSSAPVTSTAATRARAASEAGRRVQAAINEGRLQL